MRGALGAMLERQGAALAMAVRSATALTVAMLASVALNSCGHGTGLVWDPTLASASQSYGP